MVMAGRISATSHRTAQAPRHIAVISAVSRTASIACRMAQWSWSLKLSDGRHEHEGAGRTRTAGCRSARRATPCCPVHPMTVGGPTHHRGLEPEPASDRHHRGSSVRLRAVLSHVVQGDIRGQGGCCMLRATTWPALSRPVILQHTQDWGQCAAATWSIKGHAPCVTLSRDALPTPGRQDIKRGLMR